MLLAGGVRLQGPAMACLALSFIYHTPSESTFCLGIKRLSTVRVLYTVVSYFHVRVLAPSLTRVGRSGPQRSDHGPRFQAGEEICCAYI